MCWGLILANSIHFNLPKCTILHLVLTLGAKYCLFHVNMTVGLLKHGSVWNKMPHLTTIPKSLVARLELMADLHSRSVLYVSIFACSRVWIHITMYTCSFVLRLICLTNLSSANKRRITLFQTNLNFFSNINWANIWNKWTCHFVKVFDVSVNTKSNADIKRWIVLYSFNNGYRMKIVINIHEQ